MTKKAIINSIFPSTTTAIAAIPESTKPRACVQSLYAEDCENDRYTACSGGVVYRWHQDHWYAQTQTESNKEALKWLKSFDRAKATAAVAQTCVDTAVLEMRALPDRPRKNATIVPLKDRWLVVQPDGQIYGVEPDPAVGITHRISCDNNIPEGHYVPQQLPDDSLFAKFLNSSLPDKEVQNFVQEYVGSTFIANNRFQVGTLWIGAGSNGKSLLLNVVRALHERSAPIRLDKLDGFDLQVLVGASLAYCDETPKSKINQQALKSLISGGSVQINRKFLEPIDYRCTAKFIICSNHLPSAADQTDGWWRRLHIVEWNQQIKGKQIIYSLDDRIVDEELGIVLDWALLGLQRLLARGQFAVPEVMEKAKQEAIQATNTVSSWIQDAGVALSKLPGQMMGKPDIYERYGDYCNQLSVIPVSYGEFCKRLKAIFPAANEDRPVVNTKGQKMRVRRIGLVIGQFDVGVSAEDPQADINSTVMANIPMSDEDFDPFKNM